MWCGGGDRGAVSGELESTSKPADTASSLLNTVETRRPITFFAELTW